MKLTIESTIDNNDKLRIEKLADGIFMQIITNDGMKEIFLTAFETQAIASALLQMAAKLEYPHDVFDEGAATQQAMTEPIIENQSDYQIEEIRRKRDRTETLTVTELVEQIEHLENGDKRLITRTGRIIVVYKDVWEKESHLQADYDTARATFMNIKRPEGAAYWELVDTLPF